jgi:hypothetical protein
MRSLTELLPQFVSAWNNATPMHALAQSSEPEQLKDLRDEYEERLRAIACDEEGELREAAARSQQALEDQARRAAEAIAIAEAPVREACVVTRELGEALNVGSGSLGQACEKLARFCRALTEPRRSWLTEQAIQHSQDLAASAPRTGEADRVRSAAESMRVDLDSQSATLRRAIEGLEQVGSRLSTSEVEANRAAAEASGTRDRIVARAANAQQMIQRRRLEAQASLVEAQRVQQQLAAEQALLVEAQNRVTETEQENARRHRANEDLAAENRRRAAEAARRSEEIQRIRTVEIPRLEREAEEASRRLAAMDPETVAAKHRAATAAQELAAADLRAAEAKVEGTEVLLRQAKVDRDRIAEKRATFDANQAEIEAVKKELEAAKNAREVAQRELEAAVKQIEADIADLKRQQAGNPTRSIVARIRMARAALDDIRNPRRRGLVRRVWRAIVEKQP